MNKSDIQALIAQNRLEEAIEAMRQLADGSRYTTEVLLQASRFNEMQQQNRRGTLSPAEIERTRNQITHALLELLKELPDKAVASVSLDKPSVSSPDEKKKRGFPWPQIVAMTVTVVGIAGGIAEFSGYSLRDIFGAMPKDEIFTLTVSIRTKKPSPDYPDLKNAELWLWQRNEWSKSSISPEGVADFKNLDSELVGKRVAIQLKAPYFRAAIDSLLIEPPSTTLDLQADGSLERVFGKVSDPRGNPLPGIVIEVESRFDTTDAAGNYELRIPAELQKTHYLLLARDPRKKGFSPYRDDVWPASGGKNFSLKL